LPSIHCLALAPFSLQLFDRRQDSAPHCRTVKIAFLEQLIGPAGSEARRFLACWSITSLAPPKMSGSSVTSG
jgi:hypothetical protein